jgi:PTH1 family peptidyl-tRNA hydrolase
MIVGLGNVGSKYAGTRHNLGFEVVDELARRFQAPAPRARFDARVQEVHVGGDRVILVAPTTMMNNSGHAVAQLANWYKLSSSDMLVIYDELDLAFGKLRLRPSGGAGGHNGVRSVIEQLGRDDFPRLRIGVGRPTSGSTISYLLSRFSVEQRQYVPEIVALAADAAEYWLRHDLDAAMNEYNRRSVDIRSESAAGSPQTRGI